MITDHRTASKQLVNYTDDQASDVDAAAGDTRLSPPRTQNGRSCCCSLAMREIHNGYEGERSALGKRENTNPFFGFYMEAQSHSIETKKQKP